MNTHRANGYEEKAETTIAVVSSFRLPLRLEGERTVLDRVFCGGRVMESEQGSRAVRVEGKSSVLHCWRCGTAHCVNLELCVLGELTHMVRSNSNWQDKYVPRE